MDRDQLRRRIVVGDEEIASAECLSDVGPLGDAHLRAMLLRSERLAALGQVVSGIAHELNNPLMAITGFADLVLKRWPDLPSAARSHVQRIVEESMRCGALVRNLLTFARDNQPEWGLVRLDEVLRDTLDLLRYRLRAMSIEVAEDYMPDLPVVQGDVHRLRQVFLNLIINAQQALDGSPQRRIAVQARDTTWSDDHGQADCRVVQVVVSDTGPGIPTAILAKIFEPFFTTKEPGKGTGLGLAISHSIVTTHRGRLYVNSEEGKGASFFVELPVPREEPNRVPADNGPLDGM
jgi:signal transduction histidine kinase